MTTNKYVQIITDQRKEIAKMDISLLCDRKEESLIELDSPLAQIVIGVRRSGKSTICHKVLKQNGISYAYVNFDDERLYDLKGENLNDVLEALQAVYRNFKHLLIDEIQNINEWYLFVNRLLRQNIRVFVTGSNAKLLSGELATHLTGRFNLVELYPFSFSEYCRFKKIDTGDLSTLGSSMKKVAFDEYMEKGGFPELFRIRDSRSYIRNLFDSIIYNDILPRFKLRYVKSFRDMAGLLIDNFGQELNYKKLAERFDFASSHTAENYVSYLKRAYLLVGIHKFSYKSKERIRGEKVYAVDTAFIQMRAGTMAGNNLGWRLENILCVELLRRARPLSEDLYYFRNQQYEIDFVVCSGTRVKELIQVSMDISDRKTFKREISALRRGAEELRCDNLTLIALNGASWTEELQGIRVVSAIDWLLEES